MPWDSKFFGCKVGELRSQSPESDARAMARMRECGTDLVYWLDPCPQTVDVLRDEFADLLLTDVKVTYRKSLTHPTAIANDLIECTKVTPAIEDLAVEAGHLSRFRRDPNIPAPKIAEMYRVWIRNAAAQSKLKKDASSILISGTLKAPNGLITVESRATGPTIGLIAVQRDAREKGIGTQLMRQAESRAFFAGHSTLTVVTQKCNAAATHLYRSCHYELCGEITVFHVWLRHPGLAGI